MNMKKKPTTTAIIVIRLNGDETVATILNSELGFNGPAVAKRNPKDEYDAYIGARVALDRLFDKDFFEEHQEDDDPKKSADSEETETPKGGPKFQVGDIVRVTNAYLTFGRYGNGDVAVVTEANLHTKAWFRTTYRIKVRSKERKGSEGVAFAEELTLLHRPAKEGEKR